MDSQHKVEPPGFNIFQALAKLDLNKTGDVIAFIQKSYAELLRSGYQVGSGNRDLVKVVIAKQLEATEISIADLDKFMKAADIFEMHENQLVPGEHVNIYALATVMNEAAEELLARRYVCVAVSNIELFTKFDVQDTPEGAEFVEGLASPLTKKLAEITEAPTQEKFGEILAILNFIHEMRLLKKMIDAIFDLEHIYVTEYNKMPVAYDKMAITKLKECIGLCLLDFNEKKLGLKEFFYTLWEQVPQYMKESNSYQATLVKTFLRKSSPLANILKKHVQNDVTLKEFANHCLREKVKPLAIKVETFL